MKKIIILLLSIILISCWKWNQNNDVVTDKTKIENKNIVVEKNNIKINKNKNDNKNDLSEEEFYKIKVPEDFWKTWTYFVIIRDIVYFKKILEKDRAFFKNNNEDLYFFNFRSDILYWTNYTNWKAQALNKCIYKEKIDKKEKKDFIWKICEWKDIFDNSLEHGINYAELKDEIIFYKWLINWKNKNCNFFINKNYNIPTEKKFILKKENYFICRIIKNRKYDFKKEAFFYYIAWKLWKCEYLKDKNLLKLCKEEFKF